MEEKNKVKNVNVETYAEDMAAVIGDNENGAVKRIIEEQEEYDARDKRISPESKKNKIFLFIGIFLVILSFLAVSLVYVFKKEIFTVEVAPQYMPIIFTDNTAFKEISGLKKDEIAQTILNEVNTALFKDGGIEGIYLTVNKKVLGFRGFLSLMEANLNQTQIDFINDNFLIGATNKEIRNPFILLKMRSITDVFDPMRVWEGKMFSDLHGIFGVGINADTKYLLEKDFEDGIVQNKNARILYDKDGKIVMMYVYAEEDSLIITNSETAVSEVMLRLASSQIRK
jgi:flagellar basal body-associated protein FliL